MGQQGEFASDLASRLVAYRRRLGITQVELARLVGTTDQSIGRWEAGAAPQPRFRRRLEELMDGVLGESAAEGVLVQFPSARSIPLERPALSPDQLRLVDSFAARMASGVPLTDKEFEAIRSLSRAAGIPWDEQ